MWRFPDGREHAIPDVAFIAHPVGRVECVQDARKLERRSVVAASVDRVGDPCQRAVQVAQNLDVEPVVLCLPEYSSG